MTLSGGFVPFGGEVELIGLTRRRRSLIRSPAAIRSLFALTFFTGLFGVGVFPAARAEVLFSATSSAQGSQVELDSTSVPLSTSTAAGGPTAQTLLDSNGTSRAYAASPDPSATGSTAPGLVCTLSGLPLPPQGCRYPLFVTTDRGQPDQSAGTPGNSVSASSKDTSTDAGAREGTPPSQVTVHSVSSISPAGVVATVAQLDAQQITLGGLGLHAIHVSASATRSVDGRLTVVSDLRVGDLSVAGQHFGLSNGAFTVAGNPAIPVPAGVVEAVVKGAGLDMTFQKAQRSPTGVVSPSLSFHYVIPASPAARPVAVTVAFGGASATISGLSTAAAASPPESQTISAPLATTTGDAGGPPAAAPAQEGPAPVAIPLATGPASVPLAPASHLSTTSAATQPRLARRAASALPSLANLYLVLVGAALFIFAAATGLRFLGVKLIWNI